MRPLLERAEKGIALPLGGIIRSGTLLCETLRALRIARNWERRRRSACYDVVLLNGAFELVGVTASLPPLRPEAAAPI